MKQNRDKENPECSNDGQCYACSVDDHENEPPKHYQSTFQCPHYCKKYRMHQSMDFSNLERFTIDMDQPQYGLMLKKNHPFEEVVMVRANP